MLNHDKIYTRHFNYNNAVFPWLLPSNRLNENNSTLSEDPVKEVSDLFKFSDKFGLIRIRAFANDIKRLMKSDDILELYDINGRIAYFSDNFFKLSSAGFNVFVHDFRDLYEREPSITEAFNQRFEKAMSSKECTPHPLESIPAHLIREKVGEKRCFRYEPKFCWRVDNQDSTPFGILILSNAKRITGVDVR